MRKALVVGINHYMHASQLYGCVDDAYRVKSVLERNSDGTVNFSVKLLSGTGPTDQVLRSDFREHIQNLFAGDATSRCNDQQFHRCFHLDAYHSGHLYLQSESRR